MFWFRWPKFPVDCGWWIGPPPKAWDWIGIEAGDQDSEATTPLAQQLNDFHHSSKCIALLQIGSRGLLSSLGLMQIGLQLELVEVTRCTILSLAAWITALSCEDSDSTPKRFREDPDNDLLLFLADAHGKESVWVDSLTTTSLMGMGIWISNHYKWVWVGIRQNNRLLIGPPPL